jgi:thiol-disulfide isomerase/thioredoxin
MLLGCGNSQQGPTQAPDERQSGTAKPIERAEGETPQQRYAKLRKEYDAAREAHSAALQGARADPGRQKDVAEKRDRVMEFAGRFLALAEGYPEDPVAFDARATVAAERAQDRFDLDDEVRALGELVRHHVGDPRIGRFCHRMRYLSRTPYGAQGEAMLRAVAAKNPNPEVQARANYYLAETIEDRVQFARYFRRNPGEAAEPLFRAMLGAEGLKQAQESDPDKSDEEAARLYELVVERAAGTRDEAGRLDDQAKSRLFALRNLGIGKLAPDISGTDLDGKPLRLSDLRGKVVVLNFWATWCGPCMSLVPRERDLVARLKEQPFALVGVNCDKDGEAAKTAAAREGMTWRSFSDGDPATGPIVSSWGINSWPTIYVLDTKGIIRFKNVDFPNKERFEDAVDLLLRAAPPGPQR